MWRGAAGGGAPTLEPLQDPGIPHSSLTAHHTTLSPVPTKDSGRMFSCPQEKGRQAKAHPRRELHA